MIESKLRPKVVLWWGISLTTAGVLSSVLIPNVAFNFVMAGHGSTPVDQGLLMLVDISMRVVAQGLAPLGVALVGAGIVMEYVTRLLGTRSPENEKSAAPVE